MVRADMAWASSSGNTLCLLPSARATLAEPGLHRSYVGLACRGGLAGSNPRPLAPIASTPTELRHSRLAKDVTDMSGACEKVRPKMRPYSCRVSFRVTC